MNILKNKYDIIQKTIVDNKVITLSHI